MLIVTVEHTHTDHPDVACTTQTNEARYDSLFNVNLPTQAL